MLAMGALHAFPQAAVEAMPLPASAGTVAQASSTPPVQAETAVSEVLPASDAMPAGAVQSQEADGVMAPAAREPEATAATDLTEAAWAGVREDSAGAAAPALPLHWVWLAFVAGLALGLLLGAWLWQRFFSVYRDRPERDASATGGSGATAFERLVAATGDSEAAFVPADERDEVIPATSLTPVTQPERRRSRYHATPGALADAFGPLPMDEDDAADDATDPIVAPPAAPAQASPTVSPAWDAPCVEAPSVAQPDAEAGLTGDVASPAPDVIATVQDDAGPEPSPRAPIQDLLIPQQTAPYDVYGGRFTPTSFTLISEDAIQFAPLRDQRKARPPISMQNSSYEQAHERARHAWDQADLTREPAHVVEAVEALEAWLSLEPDDVLAAHRLACCQLEMARLARDEMDQARYLDQCLTRLYPILGMDDEPAVATLAMLGEAGARRALLDLSIDSTHLAEAESLLRQAMAMGMSDDSDAAWWLHRLLAARARDLDDDTLAARARESRLRLERGARASAQTLHRDRWRTAMLEGDIAAIEQAQLSPIERRERLRQLHARYAGSMTDEPSAQVLAPWVHLMCLMADGMVGPAARERLDEVAQVIARMHGIDTDGRWHAMASWRLARSRLRIEDQPQRMALLDTAQATLQPFIDDGDAALSLEAARLALVRARHCQDPADRAQAQAQAAELARPLTAVPSVAVPALHCVLEALLALGDDQQRRVYVSCLNLIAATDDGDSALLLARNAARDRDVALACSQFVRAWRHRGNLPATALLQWRECHAAWVGEEHVPAWRDSQRYLSMAGMRRR